MKAIARSRSPAALAALSLSALLAACSAPPPPAAIKPPALVIPEQPAPRPVPSARDWRDLMPPPGTWRWQMLNGRSTAQFVQPDGAALASLSCDLATRQVQLGRPGQADGIVSMGVTTTGTGSHIFTSNPAASPQGWVMATIPAQNRMLDAMAFSRGRFLLDVAGLPSLALPSWPEVSRVIEDCR